MTLKSPDEGIETTKATPTIISAYALLLAASEKVSIAKCAHATFLSSESHWRPFSV